MTLSSVGGIDKQRTGLTVRKSNQSYELVVCYDFIGSWELSRSLSQKAVKYMNDEVLPIGFKAEVPGWGSFDTAKQQYAWLLFLILAVMYVMLAMTFEVVPLPACRDLYGSGLFHWPLPCLRPIGLLLRSGRFRRLRDAQRHSRQRRHLPHHHLPVPPQCIGPSSLSKEPPM